MISVHDSVVSETVSPDDHNILDNQEALEVKLDKEQLECSECNFVIMNRAI